MGRLSFTLERKSFPPPPLLLLRASISSHFPPHRDGSEKKEALSSSSFSGVLFGTSFITPSFLPCLLSLPSLRPSPATLGGGGKWSAKDPDLDEKGRGRKMMAHLAGWREGLKSQDWDSTNNSLGRLYSKEMKVAFVGIYAFSLQARE